MMDKKLVAGVSILALGLGACAEKTAQLPVTTPYVEYKVQHPVFSEDEKGRPAISYIDQFPEPKNMKQGNFLQKLSDSLEESNNKVITKLPVGSTIIANNYFWLHGRKPFKENKNLSRELLRIRGSFFNN